MEAVKLVEQQRKASEEIRESFAVQNSFVIIPFQVSGIQDYTNAGYVNYQINPEDAETFKRVWTGNDSCVLSWYKSVSLNQATSTSYSYNYKIGDYILGEITSNDSVCELSQDVSYSEYTSQQVRKTVSFRVDATKKTISDYYQLMLYKIPTYSKDTVYRLESIDRVYFNKTLLAYQLTFISINQDLANTGKAKQQNINMSAPGQGYLNPMVMTKNEFNAYLQKYPSLPSKYYQLLENGEYLVGDQTKLANKPVKKVIVKLFGNGILSTISFIGRPAGNSFSDYKYQRLIFPINFTQPTTPTLYRTQLNNVNCYYGAFAPTLKYWKDVISAFKDMFAGVNKWEYEGFFLYKLENIQNSNPIISSTGLYTYSLYKENNNSWLISTDLGTAKVWGTQGVYNTYTLGSNKLIHNRMWDAYWVQKNMIALPLDVSSTLTFGNTLNAGIASAGGAIFSKSPWLLGLGSGLFLIGAFSTWLAKMIQSVPSPYYGIVNAPLIDYTNDLFTSAVVGSQGYDKKLLMNVFSDNNDNPASLLFSNDTVNFSIEAELTDQFTITNGNNVQLFSTGNIGQTNYEEGGSIPSAFLKTNGTSTSTKTLLVSGVETLVSPTNVKGYIIDQIQINAAFKGDISIEFLDTNNEIVWSGVYQSQGKWSNSIREVWTLINTSVLNRENMFYTTQLPYPKALPEPSTDGLVLENIVANFSQEFGYTCTGGFSGITNITCGNSNKQISTFVTGNVGISHNEGRSFTLFSNYYWNSTNLQQNWKAVELTFTDSNNQTYTTTIPFANIPGLGTSSNTLTPQYSRTVNVSNVIPFSGTQYTCRLSGHTGGVGRPIYKWTQAEISTTMNFQLSLNLKYVVIWDSTSASFVIKQTTPNNLVASTLAVLGNNLSLNTIDPTEKYVFTNTFYLTTAKLLLK